MHTDFWFCLVSLDFMNPSSSCHDCQNPKMSIKFAADKRKHVKIKKLSCSEAGKWYKNESKSKRNHDLLHIFMMWTATVLFFF